LSAEYSNKDKGQDQITMNSQNSNSLDKLFNSLSSAISKFEACGKGNICIDIQMHPGIGGKEQLKINAKNLIEAPFAFSKEEFKNFLDNSPVFNTQANLIFRHNLLEIIKKTGFGSIDINFTRDKKKTLVCRVTHSYRYFLE
jgi:hypothetical protein